MSISTTGFSDTAQTVFDYRMQEELRLRETETFGLNSGLRGELEDVWGDCQQPNWDGYQALPVARDTLRNAYLLLEMWPQNLPAPTIAAEADGHLTLEWYQSPTRVLSVSVSPEGDLHYAALLGPRRSYGTEIFSGRWPSRILELAKEVHPR